MIIKASTKIAVASVLCRYLLSLRWLAGLGPRGRRHERRDPLAFGPHRRYRPRYLSCRAVRASHRSRLPLLDPRGRRGDQHWRQHQREYHGVSPLRRTQGSRHRIRAYAFCPGTVEAKSRVEPRTFAKCQIAKCHPSRRLWETTVLTARRRRSTPVGRFWVTPTMASMKGTGAA